MNAKELTDGRADGWSVELRLLVRRGDPVSGQIRVEWPSDRPRADEPVAFSGWIELMGAINAARNAGG